MRKTKVINLIGAPSSGKSLCAGLIFAELKINKYVTEYVQEFAKTLVWKGETDTLCNQYYVSTEQYKLLKSVNGKVDYIVTDGALLLGLYYNKTYTDNVSDLTKTGNKILEYMSEFDNIYIFLERGPYDYEKEGRVHTYEQSLIIHRELKTLLNNLKLEYKTFKSEKKSIDGMVKYITEF